MIPLALALEGRGVLVAVTDESLGGAPAFRFTSADGRTVSARLRDDGEPPDANEGDRIWSGRLDGVVGDEGRAELVSGERTWVATVTVTGGANPRIDVRPAEDGSLAQGVAKLETTMVEGVTTWNNQPIPMDAGTMRTEGGAEALRPGPVWWAPWLLAAASGAVGIGWLRTLTSRRPPGLPLGRRDARPCVRRSLEGDPTAFLAALPVGARVAWVGPAPGWSPEPGRIWWAGPGRAVVDDVVALVRHLGEDGAPVFVVIAGPLEGAGGLRGERAVDALHRRMPAGTELLIVSAPPPPGSLPSGAAR